VQRSKLNPLRIQGESSGGRTRRCTRSRLPGRQRLLSQGVHRVWKNSTLRELLKFGREKEASAKVSGGTVEAQEGATAAVRSAGESRSGPLNSYVQGALVEARKRGGPTVVGSHKRNPVSRRIGKSCTEVSLRRRRARGEQV
jgi:hypothetical protein